MTKVSFFTPLTFGAEPKSYTQSLVETVDSYFYLGGKKAYVIPEHLRDGPATAVLTQHSPPFLLTALKVISYLTVAIPFAMLIAKVLLRSTHTYHLIDPQQELEKGMDLPQDTIAIIERLIWKIEMGKEDPQILWHKNTRKKSFILTQVPNLIFKIDDPIRCEKRFVNMIKAKEVCLTHQLNLIIIPHAKKIYVDGMTIIAENRLEFNSNKSFQERLYKLDGLDRATKQLATFIALTKLSHVDWDKIPVLDSEEGEAQVARDRRIALVDLEKMEDASIGFFGAAGLSRGLIRCLGSQDQINAALSEAKRYNILRENSDAKDIKIKRLEELEEDEKLDKFYVEKGILNNPHKLIQVDNLDSLGLDLTTNCTYRSIFVGGRWMNEYSPITMEGATIQVIDDINHKILTASENASLKEKRHIKVSDCGLPDGWLKLIIEALVKKRYIFKLDDPFDDNYFIQA